MKTINLCLGIHLSPDLKYQLEKSIVWKRYQIEHGNEPSRLRMIPLQQKEYLGYYFENDKMSWSELSSRRVLLQNQIAIFFPEHPKIGEKTVLFAQPMVS